MALPGEDLQIVGTRNPDRGPRGPVRGNKSMSVSEQCSRNIPILPTARSWKRSGQAKRGRL